MPIFHQTIMIMNKILDVFQTACDAYLEFLNNFLTREEFTYFYDLDEKEVDELFKAKNDMENANPLLPWICLDYYFTKRINKDYAEKDIHH